MVSGLVAQVHYYIRLWCECTGLKYLFTPPYIDLGISPIDLGISPNPVKHFSAQTFDRFLMQN
jgi:hypothetical protein